MRLPDVSDLVRRRVAIAPFLGLAVIGIEAFVDHDALLLEEDGAEDVGIKPDPNAARRTAGASRRALCGGPPVTEPDATLSPPPIHIEETIQAIAGLRAEHHANATQHQRVVDRITTLMGGAKVIAALSVFVVAWVGLNGLAAVLGYHPLDAPPFAWLADAASLASLYLVILILTTQRGDDRLTQRLELLNLELAILSEQKIAKVVALLEELRQDSPHLRDRVDEMAEAMSRPADPRSVIDAIKETRSASAQALRKAAGE